MTRPRFRTTLPLLLLVAFSAAQSARATEIEPGIHRIHGLDGTLSNEDLEPLGRIVGKAEIFGLGEAFHTVGDFYRAKSRIFKYLVEEHGFRVLGFESPWIAAERVARYVQECDGSARTALRGLYGVWQSASVLELVNWMCRWNEENPDDRVYFYGFDIQQTGDIRRLSALVIDLGLEQGDLLATALLECLRNRLESSHETCLEALDEITKQFDRSEPEIVAAGTEEKLAWARIHVVGLRSHEEFLWYQERDPKRAGRARDSGMAFVAEAIRAVRFPDARTALWAHNYHVARGRIQGFETMGLYLKRSLKRKYRTLGLIASEASVDWQGLFCGPYATAERGSVEDLLRQLGEPLLLVDLAFPGGDPPFLDDARRYEINWGWRLTPRKRFSGLFYIESAERMRPLAWPPCG